MIDAQGNVVHDVRFPHSIARVWAAISDRDALGRWLMPNDFAPVVGHRFHFEAEPSRGLIDAEVLEVDPPRLLRMRWMLDGAATTVLFTLEPDGDGTLVHVEHTDLPGRIRPDFDSGWPEKFAALTLVLEKE